MPLPTDQASLTAAYYLRRGATIPVVAERLVARYGAVSIDELTAAIEGGQRILQAAAAFERLQPGATLAAIESILGTGIEELHFEFDVIFRSPTLPPAVRTLRISAPFTSSVAELIARVGEIAERWSREYRLIGRSLDIETIAVY